MVGSFSLMFKRLVAQRRQLALTIAAVAWAALSISSLLSIGEGLRLSLGKSLGQSGKTTLTVQAGETSQNYHGTPINTPVHLTENNTKSWAKIPGVRAMSLSITFTAKAINGKQSAYVMPQAVTSNYASTAAFSAKQPGRFLNVLDESETRKTVVIGSEVAKSLFPKKHTVLGDFFYLGGMRFRIIGVLATSMSSASASSNGVFIPLTTYYAMTDKHNLSSVMLLLDNPDSLPQVKATLLENIAKDQGFSPTDQSVLQFASTAKQAKTMNTFLMGFQVFLGVIGSMTLLVAGVGVANVMLMSIKKATKTIGLQMAIGATYRQVLIQYFFESFLVTAMGGLIGILLTVGWIQLFDLIPLHGKSYTMMGSPRPVLSIGVFISVAGILTLIGFFAAYFPARNAARVNPAVALHEE